MRQIMLHGVTICVFWATDYGSSRTGIARTLGLGVDRSGDTESFGLFNRFAQQVNQRFANAVVGDASRGEKEFHDASPFQFNDCRKQQHTTVLMTAHLCDDDEASW